MNRQELITRLAAKLGGTKKHTAEVLDALREVVDESIASGEGIRIVGLGSLEVVDVPARECRNPSDGSTVFVDAHKTVKVKLSRGFKNPTNA